AVAILNDVSVAVHIAGVLVIMAAVFWFAPAQPVSFLTLAVNSSKVHYPYAWAFLLGLLQAHWTFTGFDGSAQVCEETSDPRRGAAWGIVLSFAIAGIFGYGLLLALTIAIRSIPEVLAAKDAHGESIPAAIAILQTALGAKAGNAMGALASMAMWFCGLSCITAASRCLYALARDYGTPKSSFFRRVNPERGTPGPAIWGIVIATMATMAWSGAIPVVTSLSTVALYCAYIVPVFLGWRARRSGSEWTQRAVWTLGRWGPVVNMVAILYTIFICFVLM